MMKQTTQLAAMIASAQSHMVVCLYKVVTVDVRAVVAPNRADPELVKEAPESVKEDAEAVKLSDESVRDEAA